MIDIEKLAVSSLENKLSYICKIRTYFNKNDKEPMFDGKINLYKEENCSKDSFDGDILVQIKGQYRKKLPNTIYYSADISDLKGFKLNNGGIYFVVGFDENNPKTTKIYYEDLLPIKINDYLRDVKDNQKTKNIKLRILPDNESYIFDIFYNFRINQKKQCILQSLSGQDPQNLLKNNNEEISYVSEVVISNTKNSDIFDYVRENGLYLYARQKSKNKSIDIPIKFVTNVNIRQVEYKQVSCGNIIYDKYYLNKNLGIRIFNLGDNIQITLDKNELKFELKLISKKLSSRIKDVSFFLNLKNYDLIWDGKVIKKEQTNFNNDYNELNKHLDFLQKIKEALNIIHLDEDDINFDLLKENNYKLAKDLINLFCLKKTRVLNVDNIPNCCKFNFKIGYYLIPIILFKEHDNICKVIDFYNFDISVSKHNQESKSSISKYTLLNKETLLHMKLDFQDLFNDIVKYDNIENYNYSNMLSLEMIKVFDDSKNESFINCAKNILEYINSKQYDINYRLNLIQCNKRINKLSENEKKYLLDLINDANVDDIFKVACYALLDMPEQANIILDKLPVDNQKMIKDFPINKFL